MSRHEYQDSTDIGGSVGNFFGNMVAAAVIAILIVIAMELYRLHADNPPWADTEGGKKTRIAGLLFLLSIGLTVLLALSPQTHVAAHWTASIGFLLWVIAL